MNDSLTQDDIDKYRQISDDSNQSITREEADITMYIMSQSFKTGAILGFSVATIAYTIAILAARVGGLI